VKAGRNAIFGKRFELLLLISILFSCRSSRSRSRLRSVGAFLAAVPQLDHPCLPCSLAGTPSL
jgi:hypothetical protein